MQTMSGWIAKNVGLMAFALVLSLAVWVLTTVQQDPILEADVYARVRVALIVRMIRR